MRRCRRASTSCPLVSPEEDGGRLSPFEEVEEGRLPSPVEEEEVGRLVSKLLYKDGGVLARCTGVPAGFGCKQYAQQLTRMTGSVLDEVGCPFGHHDTLGLVVHQET